LSWKCTSMPGSQAPVLTSTCTQNSQPPLTLVIH